MDRRRGGTRKVSESRFESCPIQCWNDWPRNERYAMRVKVSEVLEKAIEKNATNEFQFSQFDKRDMARRIYVHRYKTLVDGVGTHELQLMMQLEVETRNGHLGNSQRDTLYKQHFCSHREVQFPGQLVRNFGVAVLSMDGTTPDDSTLLLWERFNHRGRLIWREVEQAKLIELLRFDVDPDSLRPIGFSRNASNGSFLMSELDDRGQLMPVPTFKGV